MATCNGFKSQLFFAGRVGSRAAVPVPHVLHAVCFFSVLFCFYKHSFSCVVWPFVHTQTDFYVTGATGNLLPVRRFSENSALLFVCKRETVMFDVIFCLRQLFVRLYLLNQQQINGRRNQKGATLKLSVWFTLTLTTSLRMRGVV